MELIKLFLLGATGYLLALLYDVAVLYTKPLLQKILYVGFFVTAFPYPLLFVAYDSPILAMRHGYSFPLSWFLPLFWYTRCSLNLPSSVAGLERSTKRVPTASLDIRGSSGILLSMFWWLYTTGTIILLCFVLGLPCATLSS